MKQPSQKTKRRRWKTTTWLWILGGFAIISGLIYWDQLALLYVVSTGALTVFMIIVAFSNLKDDETVTNFANDEEAIAVASNQANFALEIGRERRERMKAR